MIDEKASMEVHAKTYIMMSIWNHCWGTDVGGLDDATVKDIDSAIGTKNRAGIIARVELSASVVEQPVKQG